MCQPRLSRQARADLRAISAALNRRQRAAARRIYDGIIHRINNLARQPLTGRTRDDDLLPGLRSSAVDAYIIIFRPIDDTVEILRVLHGSRDIGKAVREETEL